MAITRRQFIGGALLAGGAVAAGAALSQMVPEWRVVAKYGDLADMAVLDRLPYGPDDVLEDMDDENAPVADGPLIDHDALSAINGDYAAWVRVEGTDIDLPVVQSYDNEDYMRMDFWGEWSQSGCPFIDYRTTADAKTVTVYGHHMTATGGMFSQLFDLYEPDRWRDTVDGGTAWWCTPGEGSLGFKPIACMKVYQTYMPPQTFGYEPSDEQVEEALHAMTPAENDVDLVNNVSRPIWSDEQRESAWVEAYEANYHSWLRSMLDDGANDPNIPAYIADDAYECADMSERCLILVCCASIYSGEPWRTLLICTR